MRSQYGSVNPAAVVGSGIVATLVNTVGAVVYCKVKDRGRRVHWLFVLKQQYRRDSWIDK